MGRAWVTPTLAWLRCKVRVYVCLFVCGHIWAQQPNEQKQYVMHEEVTKYTVVTDFKSFNLARTETQQPFTIETETVWLEQMGFEYTIRQIEPWKYSVCMINKIHSLHLNVKINR